ncbi:hypothetical protein [Halobacillus naozhouensis]|uniref:Uncharacterized protein n=1 Tax=Halobacillus naozhouensis TaxID=554880 RepID=A0ABY8J187_9BACI|nr:hypothetical protein [Halobacillus naozhouensis]WFT75173.1 hypothetical protein P9989_01830 [Halobacillus naozhouensis]
MKSRKLKWGGIAILLITFAVAVQLSMDKGTKPKLTQETLPSMTQVNLPDNVKTAKSKDEVSQFYEKLTPGIMKAKTLGIVSSPNQEYSIPQHKGSLFLNHVWYTRNRILIYYSYDLSIIKDYKHKKNMEELPAAIADVQMEALDGDLPMQSLKVLITDPEHSIAYNGKLYTYATIPPVRLKNNTSFRNRKGVPFDQTVLTALHVEVNGDRYKTDAAPIHFTYEPGDSILRTAKLKKTYQEKGLSIELKKAEAGLTETRIILDMNHQSLPITNFFQASIKSNYGEEKEVRFLAPYGENQEMYVAEFPPFEKMPDSLTFQLEQVGLKSDDGYSFTVDVTDFKENIGKNSKGKVVDVHQKVAALHNTHVYLKKKIYHLPGQSRFIFTFKPTREEQAISLAPHDSFVMGTDYSQKPVIVENDQGSKDEVHVFSPDHKSLNISVSAHSIMGADELTFTVKEAAISQRINHEFTFDLKTAK